jgi:UDPglucose 6-dehydrogenase
MDINRSQRKLVVNRLRDMFGSLDGLTFALLGLSFKPNTDDLREAPALEIAHLLYNEGAKIRAYDPLSNDLAKNLLPDGTYLAKDAYDAAHGANAVVIVTEWNEFKQLDLRNLKQSLAQPVVIDGRNIYDPQEMEAAGFQYFGIGRGRPRIQFGGKARTNGTKPRSKRPVSARASEPVAAAT